MSAEDQPYHPPQGQYPHQGQQPNGGDPSSGPPRGRLIAIFAGLGIVALLIGVGAAHLLNKNNTSQTSLSGAATPTPTTGSQQSVSATSDPDAASSTPSAVATQPPNYQPIPANPTSEKDLDFGYLTKVTSSGGQVSLRFDRATFYAGAAAIKHNKGVAPPDDYLIENTNSMLRTFVLDPKASVTGVNRLLTNPTGTDPQSLSIADFVKNSQAALASSTAEVPVWLRHTNGLTGQVTALAEQYIP